MINAELLRENGILIVSPVATLEAIDFERVRLLVDPISKNTVNSRDC